MFDLISTDDHLLEPPELWQQRLPAKLREAGPRLIEADDGLRWLVEDEQYRMPIKNEFVAGRGDEAFGTDQISLRREDLEPAYIEPVARMEALRSDGIVGSINFPTLPRFAGTLFLQTKDKDLASACVVAYNDFVIDEWCGAAPGFFIPMIITQLWDPQAAAAEIRRTAALGNRAVSLPENPFPLGLPSFFSDYWDPIWDAVQETETCVCMHVGTSSSLPRPSPEAPFTVSITLVQNNAAECFVNLAFSPVLAKFPRIQFMLSEGGIAWIPGVLERADRMWEIHGKWDTFPIKQLPSETFRSNFYCCWVGERLGMQLRHEIGLERITWEADYPHAETPWPHSQDFLDIAMADVPADEAALITHGNARRAFRWPA